MKQAEAAMDVAYSRFLFATGMECSYPMIAGPKGRDRRFDQLELSFHYQRWKEDLQLVRDLGIKFLRYGPPYHRVHLGPGRYDWEFTDLVFAEMRRLGIVPIVDLCHFGVPDWVGNFENPDWPEFFAAFAAEFARRFSWVTLYTPVNEIYVCAKLSTLAGFWNQRKTGDEGAFVVTLKHLCRANLLAIAEITKLRPEALFIQSESSEHFHLGCPDEPTQKLVRWENQRRFLSLDLLYSKSPSFEGTLYLLDNGCTREELEWFMNHGLDRRIVMGTDFYERNEQVILRNGQIKPAGEVLGWMGVTRQYYSRYHRPTMHTETNVPDAQAAPRWLWKQFLNVRHLRDDGIPVIGFTWYSLLDQIDWNSAFSDPMGLVNPVGLYDLNRRPRPVAGAYRQLLIDFSNEPLMPGHAGLAVSIPAEPQSSRRRLPPPRRKSYEE